MLGVACVGLFGCWAFMGSLVVIVGWKWLYMVGCGFKATGWLFVLWGVGAGWLLVNLLRFISWVVGLVGLTFGVSRDTCWFAGFGVVIGIGFGGWFLFRLLWFLA